MCELFALSAAQPTSVRLSLEELSRHGGGTGPHRDGWGAAFYHGVDAFLVREPSPAHDSACMRFLVEHTMESKHVIAHVRKAIRGARTLANTQPFARELGGRLHVFAHNGMLPGVEQFQSATSQRFRPLGDTDSEAAFCTLLNRLAPLWQDAAPPSLEARRQVIANFAEELRPLGPANFVYCDADALFAHADRRTQADGVIRPPGLYWLCPSCAGGPTLRIAGVDVHATATLPPLVLIASVPLSNEAWTPLAPGELLVLKDGQRIA